VDYNMDLNEENVNGKSLKRGKRVLGKLYSYGWEKLRRTGVYRRATGVGAPYFQSIFKLKRNRGRGDVSSAAGS